MQAGAAVAIRKSPEKRSSRGVFYAEVHDVRTTRERGLSQTSVVVCAHDDRVGEAAKRPAESLRKDFYLTAACGVDLEAIASGF